jgi:hypothetical protein
MSNPLVHAERAAQKWGGVPEDYLPVHQFFDSTKAHVADNRHRMILHNSFGIAVAEQVFGLAITNAEGRRVFVREISQQHVLEDLGFIPTLGECLQDLPIRPWMAGARKLANCPPAECQPQSAGLAADAGL